MWVVRAHMKVRVEALKTYVKKTVLDFVRSKGYDVYPRSPEPYSIIAGDCAQIVNVVHGNHQLKFIVANPNDIIQKLHLEGELYEREELAIIERHYTPGTVFVDIGSNIGNHAIWAATCLGAPRVIGFEPTLGQHTMLCCNVALNDLNDVIKVRKLALSSSCGTARISRSFMTTNNSGNASVALAGLGEEVAMSTGDMELSDIGPMFIKIDVEGHEMAVLEGLTQTIRQHSPTLFVEVDMESQSAFENWLDRNNYKVAESFQRYATNCNYVITPKIH